MMFVSTAGYRAISRRSGMLQPHTAAAPFFSTFEVPLRFGIERQKLPSWDELSEPVRRVLSMDNGTQAEVTQARKNKAIEAFQDRPGDTGSTKVQVAVLTVKIKAMQEHMVKHKKDQVSKRGLMSMVHRRRKLLKYYKRKDFDGYAETIKSLGLPEV